MLSLSSAAIVEKNKLASDGAWLVLLKITLPDATIIRLVRNNENIVWDGETWVAFPFEIDDMGEQRAGEIPQVTVRVGNATRAIQAYLEAGSGGIGAQVEISVVHSAHLDLADPEISLTYTCTGCNSDARWVTFSLGAAAPWRKRFPAHRIMKQLCRYKRFKGAMCGYSGVETSCDRTLARCKALGNHARFGGFPGVGSGTLRLS